MEIGTCRPACTLYFDLTHPSLSSLLQELTRANATWLEHDGDGDGDDSDAAVGDSEDAPASESVVVCDADAKLMLRELLCASSGSATVDAKANGLFIDAVGREGTFSAVVARCASSSSSPSNLKRPDSLTP